MPCGFMASTADAEKVEAQRSDRGRLVLVAVRTAVRAHIVIYDHTKYFETEKTCAVQMSGEIQGLARHFSSSSMQVSNAGSRPGPPLLSSVNILARRQLFATIHE